MNYPNTLPAHSSRKGVPHPGQRKSFSPGEVIGRWTLSGEYQSDPKSRQYRWHAFCECGRDAWVLGAMLRAGRSQSCGRCGVPSDVPVSYSGAHGQVRASRGPASDKRCVDCGERAQDWSYDHQDLFELVGLERPEGEPRVYSSRVYRYAPRCRRCHVLFDDRMERLRSGDARASTVAQLYTRFLGRLGPMKRHERARLD